MELRKWASVNFRRWGKLEFGVKCLPGDVSVGGVWSCVTQLGDEKVGTFRLADVSETYI